MRAEGDAEAEDAVLSLGLAEPRLWPEIAARGVRADVVSTPLAARVLRRAEHLMAESGILPGLAELLAAAETDAERDGLALRRSRSPGAERLPYWCERVVRAAQRQELLRVARRLGQEVCGAGADPTAAAAAAMSGLSAAIQPAAGTQIEAPAAWAEGFLAELDRRQAGEVGGVPTGFPVLDDNLVVRPGDLVIIAAETGVGKSALGLSLARIACRAGHRVAYLNTEMDDFTIQARLVGAEAGIPVDRLQTGRLTPEEADAAAVVARRMAEAGTLFLSNLRGFVRVGADELPVTLRAHHAQHGLDVFFLDYVGRMDTESTSADKEYKVLERVVQQLKCLAQELRMVAYVLVQRTWDGHLAGSKRMRNEADLVMELEPQRPEDRDAIPGATHRVGITKCRNWRSGFTIGIEFDLARMRCRQVGVRGISG